MLPHQPVEPRDEILGAKVRIPLGHLHTFVPGYRRHFLVARACFGQTRHRLVSEVVEA